MTLKQKRKLILSFAALVILAFSYVREPLAKQFPQLSPYIASATPTPEVKGESTAFVNVVRVIDGDTIVVLMSGKEEKVRLIGINSPESVDPRRPIECFGKEAKTYLSQLLTDKKVRLEADPSQQNRDKYDRLLRFVFLEDGTNINQKLIFDGYAYEYTYDTPYKYQSAFKRAQDDASGRGVGLWSESTCSGKK